MFLDPYKEKVEKSDKIQTQHKWARNTHYLCPTHEEALKERIKSIMQCPKVL
jgi:hypothetical protein